MATRYRHRSRSAFRSSTDAVAVARALLLVGLLASAAGAAGCGGDDAQCGAGDAPPDGVTLEIGEGGGTGSEVGFGQFHSSPNNDCPPPGGDGPISLTVLGTQTDPVDETQLLVLCLPRPDRIDAAPIPLDDADRVQLVNLVAAPGDGCRLELDPDRQPDGTITFSGFCDDGTHPDGYAMAFAATVPVLRTCTDAGGVPGDPEAVEAEMGGRAAVAADSTD